MSSPRRPWFRRPGFAAAAGVGLVALGLALVRPVPAGRLLLQPARHGGEPTVHSGPGWTWRLPLRPGPVWLPMEVVRLEARLAAGDGRQTALQVEMEATPDRAADPRALLSLGITGAEAALRSVLSHAQQDLGDPVNPASHLEALLDAGLREHALLPTRLVVQELTTRPPPAGATASEVRVLLVGIDSADWDLIDPLLQQGRLPHLARLRSEGAWSVLHSDVPTLSPLLWTTVVTGRPPDEHGVLDFVMLDPATGAQTPIASSFRKVKALWNILTEAGRTVGVVGWWATWPAEPVEGVLVSDRVAFSLFHYDKGERSQGVTYPPSYMDRVAQLRVQAVDIGLPQLRRFAAVSPDDFERSTVLLQQAGPESFEHPVASLRKILASTATYHRIALDLLQRAQPSWFAVYYQGLDEVNHRFAHLLPPHHPLSEPGARSTYGGVVQAFYEYQDELLGELLAVISPETVVMVLSDHGFANAAERPRDLLPYVEAGRPGRWHTLEGIWVLHGPPVRPGALAGPPVRLDQIAPTVLRLLDLPLADDMPGTPLEGALSQEFLDAHPVRRRTTYEGASTIAPRVPSLAPAAQEEMLARLRSLGYLAPDAGGSFVPGGGTMSANYHTNLASIFAGRGERERARQEFERALELLPDHPGALGGLVQLDLNEGKLEDALASARRLLRRSGPGLNPVFYFLTAYLFVETGHADDGLEFYGDLARERPQVSQVFTGLGVLLQARGDHPGALAAYRKALDGKPDALYALQELYTLEVGSTRLAQVLAYCARAIEAAPQEVMPYNWQGLTLRKLGRAQQAEASFRRALEVSPDSLRTQVNLSSLLVDGGRAEEALPLLRRVLGQQGAPREARVNLVVALGRTGRLAEAGEVFQAGEPGGTDLLNAMAFACYLNQATGRARELLQRSLLLDPEQPEARRLLAQLR